MIQYKRHPLLDPARAAAEPRVAPGVPRPPRARHRLSFIYDYDDDDDDYYYYYQ